MNRLPRLSHIPNPFNPRRSVSSSVAAISADKISRFSPSPSLLPPTSFPLGYLATGVHSGIKKNAHAHDLALIVSDRPANAAGVFTRNSFKAAPVQVCLDTLDSTGGRGVRGVVVNSGCANAVTGTKGLRDARGMQTTLDEFFKASSPSTLVMSTGVIGQLLPSQRLLPAITTATRHLSSSYPAWLAAAQAFMTTDTFPKLRTASFTLPSSPETTYRFVGIDKGAGMIHPRLSAPKALHGTLLGLIATDAPIDPEPLQAALSYAIDRSFNSISIDGDTSTNDTILLLSNGAAGGPALTSTTSPDFTAFQTALTAFATDLAKLVVYDGEGATKLLRVRVTGARTYGEAHKVAESIATSSLVKCAVHGEDANWGRILCAVGYSGVKVTPEKVDVSFMPLEGEGELKLLIKGEPEVVDEERAKVLMKEEEVRVEVRLGEGEEEATYFTCDYSKEYIAINADYRS